jgi:hypothetical protein
MGTTCSAVALGHGKHRRAKPSKMRNDKLMRWAQGAYLKLALRGQAQCRAT